MDISAYEKQLLEPCSKYDTEHDFHVIPEKGVPCHKLRWICHMHSNVIRQAEIQGKLATFVVQHEVYDVLEVECASTAKHVHATDAF